MGTVSISYVTDPFCPWSWGVEPWWRRLRKEFGDRVAITYVISGMGGAQPDPGEWLEASAATGMPVDPRGIMAHPPASTNPAGLAVKAVAEQADPEPFLRRLREAIFLERRRLDRRDALLDVARETTPALDLDTLQIAFGSHGPVEALGADFERAGGSPRPALWIGDGAAPRTPAGGAIGAAAASSGGASVATASVGTVVDGRAPYAEWRAALLAAGAEARDGALSVEDALRRFGACTTAEIAALCDLPGPRAPAELWRLALEWRVRARPVLGGELWELP